MGHTPQGEIDQNLQKFGEFFFFSIYIYIHIDTSVADPGSGTFLTPGSGMGKKLGSGFRMNNPDRIS